MSSPLITIEDSAYAIAEQLDNPDALQADGERALAMKFRPQRLEDYPYRDPDDLRETWARCETVQATADAYGTRSHTISKWLHAFGIRERHSDVDIHARDVRQLSPADLGLDDTPPEGEA